LGDARSLGGRRKRIEWVDYIPRQGGWCSRIRFGAGLAEWLVGRDGCWGGDCQLLGERIDPAK
jgi:hypothetical protein